MRFAIVDDSKLDQDMIIENLSKYFEETGDDFTYQIYENGVDFLEEYTFSFDCIIFDIDMPEMSGIDVAKNLRQKDPNVTIMFVTNMPQYALEGYAVDAVDYILKPLSYPDFRLKIKKAIRYVIRNSNRKITIKTPTGVHIVSTNDILYVESKLHYIYYHTKNNIYKMRAKLSDVEAILSPFHFSRSGGSFLINLAYLEKIEGNEIIVYGEALPLSRSMKSSLMSAFTKYIGGMDN
ncbi:MAG: LytTR family DNA-binding domain-containing protein [Lachnospiraceae bacterium]|nr:LytTR family DNA-binding domain-containing protein [Lachnospiraceae bacterium]